MKNKYNASTRYLDGKRFPSKAEAERYLVLKDKLRRGEIYDLKLQQRFEIVEALNHGKEHMKPKYYVADFTYYKDGKFVVEDVKGMKKGTAYQFFRLKKQLMLKRYGI